MCVTRSASSSRTDEPPGGSSGAPVASLAGAVDREKRASVAVA
jgi:hypothetical protein